MNGRMEFSKVWNEKGMKDDRRDSWNVCVYIYIDILKPAPPKGVNKVRVVFPSSMEWQSNAGWIKEKFDMQHPPPPKSMDW